MEYIEGAGVYYVVITCAQSHCLYQSNTICLIQWNKGIMVFNATFNDISVISWRSVLLVEETGVPGVNNVRTCRKSLTNFIA